MEGQAPHARVSKELREGNCRKMVPVQSACGRATHQARRYRCLQKAEHESPRDSSGG